jgi:hypothetical protein
MLAGVRRAIVAGGSAVGGVFCLNTGGSDKSADAVCLENAVFADLTEYNENDRR